MDWRRRIYKSLMGSLLRRAFQMIIDIHTRLNDFPVFKQWSFPMPLILNPLANIRDIFARVVSFACSVTLVIRKWSSIHVAVRVSQLAFTWSEIPLKVAHILFSIKRNHFTFTELHVILKISFEDTSTLKALNPSTVLEFLSITQLCILRRSNTTTIIR